MQGVVFALRTACRRSCRLILDEQDGEEAEQRQPSDDRDRRPDEHPPLAGAQRSELRLGRGGMRCGGLLDARRDRAEQWIDTVVVDREHPL